ncbi:hypothetical protein [Mycobacterium sp. Aquia_213]|uniref:hypothetical protein n=1 Tax=Mycobacterium sp. Aquia_213 TaxID=2991728 RepID=UPI00226DFE7D|nr:hypothetical protein [Mycobacterium sp. Aquia_213]WAC93701.1 hypothetical protein LMQ14_11555 [Mycobacterium sp. Aquia_213]
MFAFLIVALLVTLAIAIVGWFRPVQPKPPSPPTYTAQQTADAKAKVCAAYEKVHSAIKVSTGRDMGSDPTAQQVYALTGRQALLAGSTHLRTVLSAQPATPSELATAIRKLTDLFPELTIDYLNSAPDSEMEPTVRAADEATLTVERLCK